MAPMGGENNAHGVNQHSSSPHGNEEKTHGLRTKRAPRYGVFSLRSSTQKMALMFFFFLKKKTNKRSC